MKDWRKHDPHFLQNHKVMEAADAAGSLGPVVAMLLLDLNAIGDRDGCLRPREARADRLASLLRGYCIADAAEERVQAALDGLRNAGFIEVLDDESVTLCGWTQEEFGIRGQAKTGDLPPRKCRACGQSFRPKRKNHEFCSTECRVRFHRSCNANERERERYANGDTNAERSNANVTEDREIDREIDRGRGSVRVTAPFASVHDAGAKSRPTSQKADKTTPEPEPAAIAEDDWARSIDQRAEQQPTNGGGGER